MSDYRKQAARRVKERYGPFDLLNDDDAAYFNELVADLCQHLEDGGDIHEWSA